MQMETAVTHVPGRDQGAIMLYALSTCPWCHKTKELLKYLGVEYSFIDVNLAKGQEFEDAMKTVLKLDPGFSFPVLLIKGKVIVGFKEKEIREAIKE